MQGNKDMKESKEIKAGSQFKRYQKRIDQLTNLISGVESVKDLLNDVISKK